MAASVSIRVFVRAPFDKYVQDQSRFWNASGVSVKLGAGGVELQLESLRAILLGGIAFDTPEEAGPATAAAPPDTSFPCSRIVTRRKPPRTAARSPWYPISAGRFADSRQDPRSRCTAWSSAT